MTSTTLRFGLALVFVLAIFGCNKLDSRPGQEATPGYTLPKVPLDSDGLPEWVNLKPSGSFEHETSSFTQGLLFLKGKLYEGTGRYNQSKVRILDAETGLLDSEARLPDDVFGEGTAYLDGKIYQLTWRAGVCFVFNENLEGQGQLYYGTDGWGLTTDPENKLLVLSDGSSTIRFLDPKNLTTKRKIEVTDGKDRPIRQLNELEWVKGEIWANIWTSAAICRIDPTSGKVIGWIQLEDLVYQNQKRNEDVLNGIAYDPDSDRLWLTGKLWPRIYWYDKVSETFFAETVAP